MPQPNEEEVNKTAEGSSGEPSTPQNPESSPEVKPESTDQGTEANRPSESDRSTQSEQPESKSTKTVEELQTQIDNLNVALKQERDASKNKVDQSKVQELENQLKESQDTIGKLKGVFVPEEEEEKPEPEALTKEQFDELWEEKSKEAEQKREEEKRSELIQKEIKDLSQKWDGKDGKPKYDDKEVLEWQQKNDLLYLTPKQAFHEKYRDELIDYEVKQRLAGKNPVQNVEQPSAGGGDHIPPETKPKTEKETRNAVLEAMNQAEAEV